MSCVESSSLGSQGLPGGLGGYDPITKSLFSHNALVPKARRIFVWKKQIMKYLKTTVYLCLTPHLNINHVCVNKLLIICLSYINKLRATQSNQFVSRFLTIWCCFSAFSFQFIVFSIVCFCLSCYLFKMVTFVCLVVCFSFGGFQLLSSSCQFLVSIFQLLVLELLVLVFKLSLLACCFQIQAFKHYLVVLK